jgi:hypothetical protein
MARWATVEETADYLRVHKHTVYNLINKKTGVGLLFKDGPRLIADLDEVDSLMKGEVKA